MEAEVASEESQQATEIPVRDSGESIAKESKQEYKTPHSSAYKIDKYMVDKEGILIRLENPAQMENLKEQVFIATE